MNYRIKSWLTRQALKLVVYLHRDSNYIAHLKREVPGWFIVGKDDPNRWMAEGTEQLLAVLSHQGHSGGSIGYAISFFKTMARFEPFGPLTGEEYEWMEISDAEGGLQQNRRCSHVFRKNGQAYDINGKVFTDPDGHSYTSRESSVDIEFPYVPITEYVSVDG